MMSKDFLPTNEELRQELERDWARPPKFEAIATRESRTFHAPNISADKIAEIAKDESAAETLGRLFKSLPNDDSYKMSLPGYVDSAMLLPVESAELRMEGHAFQKFEPLPKLGGEIGDMIAKRIELAAQQARALAPRETATDAAAAAALEIYCLFAASRRFCRAAIFSVSVQNVMNFNVYPHAKERERERAAQKVELGSSTYGCESDGVCPEIVYARAFEWYGILSLIAEERQAGMQSAPPKDARHFIEVTGSSFAKHDLAYGDWNVNKRPLTGSCKKPLKDGKGGWGFAGHWELCVRLEAFSGGLLNDLRWYHPGLDAKTFLVGGAVEAAAVKKPYSPSPDDHPLRAGLLKKVKEEFEVVYPPFCDTTGAPERGADIDLMVVAPTDEAFDKVAYDHFAQIKKRSPGVAFTFECKELGQITPERAAEDEARLARGEPPAPRAHKWWITPVGKGAEKLRRIEVFRGQPQSVLLYHVPTARALYNPRDGCYFAASGVVAGLTGTFSEYRWVKSSTFAGEILAKYEQRGYRLDLNVRESEALGTYRGATKRWGDVKEVRHSFVDGDVKVYGSGRTNHTFGYRHSENSASPFNAEIEKAFRHFHGDVYLLGKGMPEVRHAIHGVVLPPPIGVLADFRRGVAARAAARPFRELKALLGAHEEKCYMVDAKTRNIEWAMKGPDMYMVIPNQGETYQEANKRNRNEFKKDGAMFKARRLREQIKHCDEVIEELTAFCAKHNSRGLGFEVPAHRVRKYEDAKAAALLWIKNVEAELGEKVETKAKQ